MNEPAKKMDERLLNQELLIGEGAQMQELKSIIRRVSQYDFSVLIEGESGTGKELVAKAIHQLSPRANMPFQTLNCAALTESLIESELFGYVGGAFTGARRSGSPSLFETAKNGSLFLDEVADLSGHAQAALLRVLEENEVIRVGGRHPIPIDVRIITATNRPLEELVQTGMFRQDLFHRLCVIPIQVPPLRNRREDIPLLIRMFLKQLGDPRFPPAEVIDFFCRYHWPGNVRELEHCVSYMVAITDSPFSLSCLPPHMRLCMENSDCRHTFDVETKEKQNNAYLSQDNLPLNDLHYEHIFILDTIYKANLRGTGIGRRSLTREAYKEGYSLTEGAIRSRLYTLRMKGLIDWNSGRSGIRLTPKGRNFLKELLETPN